MRIIISTCDEYRWLIPVFMYFYKKHWPDNPYQTDIVTEREHIDGSVFYTKGVSWSSGILNYLKQSKEEKFLLFLEDLLIRKIVSTERVKAAENLCEGDVGYVRVSNVPIRYFLKHSIGDAIEGFREYPVFHRFSAGLQPAIYQKRYLFDFLCDGESPWQTERNGAKRLGKLRDKWRSFWPESSIIGSQPPGLIKRGRLNEKNLKWAKCELQNDATDESEDIYKILMEGNVK